MTTGGYPPPPQDPHLPGGYPGGGSPSYGGTPSDYTQQFPQYGAPQYGAPQHGASQNGMPHYGAPQYGAPQGGQYGGFPGPGGGSGSGAPGELLPRLGARVIDSLIVGLPMAALSFIVAIASGSIFLTFVMSVLSGAVAFGYWAYLEATQGATVGKKLLGLSVVAPGGGRPTLEQTAKRNAFVALQILTGIPLLGWLVILGYIAVCVVVGVTIEQDAGKQGFHDKFAGGTQVVKS